MTARRFRRGRGDIGGRGNGYSVGGRRQQKDQAVGYKPEGLRMSIG